jgi:hypothetical protein
MTARALTTPDDPLVTVRPQMAKATLPDTTVAESLSPLVKNAAKFAHGKQHVAALVLGKDPGNFARDVDAERLTIADMKQLGPVFLAELARSLSEQYGPLRSPMDRLREIHRQQRELQDEALQIAEGLA